MEEEVKKQEDFQMEQFDDNEKFFEQDPFNVHELADTGLLTYLNMDDTPPLLECSEAQDDSFIINQDKCWKYEELRLNSDRESNEISSHVPGWHAKRSDVINKTVIRVIKRFYTNLFVEGESKIHYLTNPIAISGIDKIDEVNS